MTDIYYELRAWKSIPHNTACAVLRIKIFNILGAHDSITRSQAHSDPTTKYKNTGSSIKEERPISFSHKLRRELRIIMFKIPTAFARPVDSPSTNTGAVVSSNSQGTWEKGTDQVR